MPLARLHAPFDHPDWLFELKYDEFRALAYIDRGHVHLVSRKGNAYKSFSGLCDAIAFELDGHEAVLDGEIVYLDGDGRPQFYSTAPAPRSSAARRLRFVMARWTRISGCCH